MRTAPSAGVRPAAHTPAAPLAVGMLTLVYVVNFVDRQLVSIVAQPMKLELGLSDAQYGLLGGTAFALFYTILGLPIARIAERRSRVGIVSLSLAFWSVMTALCGLVSGYPLLLAARIGVGIGEAGCAPPSQSLVSDLVPPERRATALGLLSLGVPLGMLVAGLAGGAIAQALGWRWAFVALGLPGIVLAGVLRLVVREPARGRFDTEVQVPPPLGMVARTLIATPAFRHMAAGATLASFAGYGLTSFAAALAARRYGISIAQAGGGFGLVAGIGIGVGIASGGWIADKLRPRLPGAPGLVAGLGVIIAAVAFEVALAQQSAPMLALTALLPFACAHLYFGPTYAVTMASVGPAARATAIALLLMAMNGIGLGMGPLAVGVLSDVLTPGGCARGSVDPVCIAASAQGLGRALAIDVAIYLWAGLHFLLGARALARTGSQG